ncbi:MAG: protein kinase [Acidobacteriota bacterium]
MAERTDPSVPAPTRPSARASRRGLSLGARIFLLTVALVVLAVGGAVLVTRMVGTSVADRAVRTDLDHSVSMQSALADNRLEQLYLRALTVSGDPNFISYLVLAIESDDVFSLTDQLDERQRDLGFTFAVVLDADGVVVASTDPRLGDDTFDDNPLYRTALDTGDYVADGLWSRDDQLYYAVLVPLATSGVLQGWLVAAYLIDDDAAAEMQQATGSHVAFLLADAAGDGGTAPRLAATSLDERLAETLVPTLGSEPAGVDALEQQPRRLELGERAWMAQSKPLIDVAGERVGHVVNLASLDEALQPFHRIGQVLGFVGLAVVLLASLVSFLVARRVVEPVRRLGDAVERAAAGDFDQDVAGDERGDEVGQLASAFGTLLSELREKRDMQVYLSELSRTLPDAESSTRTEAIPTERRPAALLGIEMRELARDEVSLAPYEILERLEQELRRLSRGIMLQSGSIDGVLGHRLVAVFTGTRRSERALSAAAGILGRGGPGRFAVVLVTGQVASGTVSWGNRPSRGLTGGTVEYLEGLLRVARPGTLLLSGSSLAEVRSQLQMAAVTPTEHTSSVSSTAFYSIDGARLGQLATQEYSATQEMTQTSGTVTPATIGPTGHVTLAAIGIGSVLGGRFEIVSELGAGGMGIVYKARDRELDELVALKMLRHDAFDGPEALDRLKDELRLARKIAHPNVLRTYDFGEADGLPFISMEFVRGVTLKRLLEESGRLPLSAGLHMARQLCRGLAAAHGQSVLHRDIKPENMIIEPTGNVKLMDFGIAQPMPRRRRDEQEQGALVGTPFYLAPEQLEGRAADERADIYACGVVFFEIFTGELPFPQGGNLMQIIRRKLEQDPARPSSIWPEIPPALEQIILRCLERDRDKRYTEVATLLGDLEVLRA